MQPLHTDETFVGRRETLAQESLDHISKKWGWFIALGLALCALGLVSLSAAGFTTWVTVAFLGAILVVSGCFQIAHAFRFRLGHGFLLSIAGGIFSIVVGSAMMAAPGIGALSVTILLACFFLAGGIFRSVWSILDRPPSWGWPFASGIASSFLGAYILATLPVSAIWILGAFIGVELLLSGTSWIALGLAARTLHRADSSTESVEVFGAIKSTGEFKREA